ncbi:MAG: hypothetical protein Q8P67_28530, partial [archaeon]|nr:hypothetical protein [archaeon]
RALSRLAWQPPRGEVLAVPGKRAVVLFARESWQVTAELRHGAAVLGVAWSKNGRHLASFDAKMQVQVWELGSPESIHLLRLDNPVSSLQWSPHHSSELAFLDRSGSLSVWPKAVPERAALQADSHAAAVLQIEGAPPSAAALMPSDDEEEIPVNRKHAAAAASSSRAKNPPARHPSASSASSSSTFGLFHDEADEDDDSDVSDGDQEYDDDRDDHHYGGGELPSTSRRATDHHHPPLHRGRAPLRQKAFQPGGGPVPAGGGRHFLCHDLVGSVVSLAESGLWSLEAKFADAAHRGRRWIEHALPTVAALCLEGAVVGCPQESQASGGAVLPSTIQYRGFESWGTDSDWTLRLDRGEDVLVLAIGQGWVAAATSLRRVRVISSAGGIQRALFSLPGDPVCCVAHSSEPLLAIAFHAGDPDLSTGTQQLHLKLIDIDRSQTLLSTPLALSPGASLTWLGFAPSAAPVYCDSSEVVHLCEASYSSECVPIADLSRVASALASASSSRLWPIGMPSWNDLICVSSSSRSVHPLPFPAPAISVVPLQLPLCELTNAAVQKEEMLLRRTIQLSHARVLASADPQPLVATEAARDKLILELIHQACKDDKPVRANEFANMLTLRRSFTIAATIAQKCHQAHLSERILQIQDVRFPIVGDYDYATPSPAPLPNQTQTTASFSSSTSSTSSSAHPLPISPERSNPARAESVASPTTPSSLSHAIEGLRTNRTTPRKSPRKATRVTTNPFLNQVQEDGPTQEPRSKRSAGSLFSELDAVAKKPRN